MLPCQPARWAQRPPFNPPRSKTSSSIFTVVTPSAFSVDLSTSPSGSSPSGSSPSGLSDGAQQMCVCAWVGWGGVGWGWGGVGWGGVGKKGGGGGGGDDYTRGTRLTGWLQSSTRVGQAAAPQFEPGQRPAGCGPTPWRRCVGRVGGRAARKHGCTWLRCRPGAVVGNQHEQVGEQASKRSAFARTCKSVVCNPALPCIPLLTRWRARCSPAAVLMPRPLYGPTQLQARGRVRFQRN